MFLMSDVTTIPHWSLRWASLSSVSADVWWQCAMWRRGLSPDTGPRLRGDQGLCRAHWSQHIGIGIFHTSTGNHWEWLPHIITESTFGAGVTRRNIRISCRRIFKCLIWRNEDEEFNYTGRTNLIGALIADPSTLHIYLTFTFSFSSSHQCLNLIETFADSHIFNYYKSLLKSIKVSLDTYRSQQR